MLLFIEQNLATIVVALILVCALILAIYKIVCDKHAGKSSCGGNCSGCPMDHECNKKL